MNRLIATTILLCLSACSSSLLHRQATESAQAPNEIHNTIRCDIYGMAGQKIRQFPGAFCAFLPDGRAASWKEGNAGATDALTMHSARGEVLWEKKISLNHQLNLDLSKKHLLTLESDPILYGDHLLRGDAALVIDLDGNIVHRFSFFEHRKELERLLPSLLFSWYYSYSLPMSVEDADFSHANSIYEIPENPYAETNPAFQAGNYIINSIDLPLTFIVDHEMKKVLWGVSIDRFDTTMTHDMQVLANGHLLFYRNDGVGTRDGWWKPRLPRDWEHSCCSGLVEYDLEKGAPVWSWAANPVGGFYSPVEGGVQALANGNILFNNSVLGYAREITRTGDSKWELIPTEGLDGRVMHFQQIKRYDLSSFLQNNHDLSSIPWPADRVSRFPTSHAVPDMLWGYFNGEGVPFRRQEGQLQDILTDLSPKPPTELAGLSVRLNGAQTPASIFMAADNFFAIQLPAGGNGARHVNSAELYFEGVLAARMVSSPVEASPGRYMAEFAKIPTLRP